PLLRRLRFVWPLPPAPARDPKLYQRRDDVSSRMADVLPELVSETVQVASHVGIVHTCRVPPNDVALQCQRLRARVGLPARPWLKVCHGSGPNTCVIPRVAQYVAFHQGSPIYTDPLARPDADLRSRKRALQRHECFAR